MRLFAAVYFSEEMNNELERIQKSLLQTGVKPNKDIHITLKFFGEVDEQCLEKIKKGLSEIKFEKFKLKLSKMGYFSPRQIRIVYCDVEENNSLNKLADEIDKATDFIRSDTKFRPHITANRVSHLKNRREFVDKLKNTKVSSLNCNIEEFFLVKSDLGKEGSEYSILEKYTAQR